MNIQDAIWIECPDCRWMIGDPVKYPCICEEEE